MERGSQVRTFKQLLVWQRGIGLAEQIYRVCHAFPKHEVYGLTSQMQRSAVSVPANIAEGHARDSTKEYLRHLSIALGSLAELETHLTVAERLQYTQPEQLESVFAEIESLGRMLRSLQKSLKAKLPPAKP